MENSNEFHSTELDPVTVNPVQNQSAENSGSLKKLHNASPIIAAAAAIMGLITAMGRDIKNVSVVADAPTAADSPKKRVRSPWETPDPDKEDDLQEKYMTSISMYQDIINNIKKLSKPTTVPGANGDIVTHSVNVQVKGESYRLSTIDRFCTNQKQCPNLKNMKRDGPWRLPHYPAPFERTKVRIQNLSKGTEGSLFFKDNGLGLWVGANPDFSKEPVAYYEDPNPLPLPHDGVIEFEFHYTSKTNKRELIIEKVKKLYAGLDPLIRAKRAKEYAAKKRAEDELNKRAKDL